MCDSQEDYSDSSDSYCSSFIGDSELDDDAFYFDDQGNLRYFIKRNYMQSNTDYVKIIKSKKFLNTIINTEIK